MCRRDSIPSSQNGERQRGEDFATLPGRFDSGPQIFTTSLTENMLLESFFGQWGRGRIEDRLLLVKASKGTTLLLKSLTQETVAPEHGLY